MVLLSKSHGTQGVDTQLSNIINMLKVPPIMYNVYRYEHDIEDGIRPIGSAYVKVLTPTEQTIACKFGNTEKEVNVYNRIDMYRKGFYVYSKEYERLQKRQQNL